MPDSHDNIDAPSDALARIVELAREILRERGLSEDEIDALLSRPTAPEYGA